MASSNNDHDQVNAAAGPLKRLWGKIIKFGLKLKKLEQDDPRRIVHSLKVALALTLVSLLFYFQPLYEGFGLEAMWAILTVVVVFEFSVGKFIHITNHISLRSYIHGLILSQTYDSY